MNKSAAHHSEWRLENDQLPERVSHNSQVIAIASGKGGVGKTNITTNLGIALSMRGNAVCIFDADTSLANINIVLGLRPEFTLEHFLEDDKPLDDIMLEGPRGLRVIPAASGIAGYASLEPSKQQKLIAGLNRLESRFDYLLIDTAAGIGDDVLSFMQAAQHNIIVISPEPTSLTDAFSLIKVLVKRGSKRPIHIVVNMVMDHNNSLEVFNRFDKAVEKYLHTKVHYLGYVTLDESVIAAVQLQRPVLTSKPDSPASRCLMAIAKNINTQIQGKSDSHAFSEYWQHQAHDGKQASTDTGTHHKNEHSSSNMADQKGMIRSCNHLLDQWLDTQDHATIIPQLLQKLDSLIVSMKPSAPASISTLATRVLASLDHVLQNNARPETAYTDTIKRILNYIDKTMGMDPEIGSADMMETLIQQLQKTQPPGPATTEMSHREHDIGTPAAETGHQRQTDTGYELDPDAQNMLERLVSGTVTQEEAKSFIQTLTDTYVERFSQTPFDMRNMLYRTLETQNFPDTEIKEIALTLESIYEKRKQQPMRNTEDATFKLMEQINDDEQKIVELHGRLQSIYKRRFDKELTPQSDHAAALYEQVSSGRYNKEEIDDIIRSLKQAYSQHHKSPYQDERDILLNKALKMITQIKQQEDSLREGLKNLSSSFQDSVASENRLLASPNPRHEDD